MKEELVKTAKEKLLNPESTVPVKLVFTFRTQKLLNLWVNEMSGQISDGNWENSRNTAWIWSENQILQLGDETSVKYYTYDSRRTNFYMSKELCDIIGQRAMEEAGFETIKEMREGWRELADAIKSATPYNTEEYNLYVEQPAIRNAKRCSTNSEIIYNTLKESKYVSMFSCSSPNNIAVKQIEYKDKIYYGYDITIVCKTAGKEPYIILRVSGLEYPVTNLDNLDKSIEILLDSLTECKNKIEALQTK